MKLFLTLCVLLFTTTILQPQDALNSDNAIIDLSGEWLLQTGDNPEWSGISFDDSGWKKVAVPAFWEDEGHENYDGYGWYRFNFNLDSIPEGKVYIVAGRIDDVDRTWLNGQLIGGMGALHPVSLSEWGALRIYPILNGLLRNENQIAIRVYDSGAGGGIYQGPLGIYSEKAIQEYSIRKKTAKRSFYQLPLSNGLSACYYDAKEHTVNGFMEHIYSQVDEQTRTEMLLEKLEIEFIEDESIKKPADAKSQSVSYINGSGIVRSVYQFENFAVKLFAMMPFSIEQNLLILKIVLQGENKLPSVKLRLTGASERLSLLEKTINVSENETITYGIIGFSSEGRQTSAKLGNRLKELDPTDLFNDEIKWWDKWHEKEKIPKGLEPPKLALYRQSSAILKMGQSREPGVSGGQIVASLPPGIWSIAWVRDSAYAIMGLLRSGHYEEAKYALQFLYNARVGDYKKFKFENVEHGIGKKYAISVCRYYGNGTEWSDHNDRGPNIELDGFGLMLWITEEYVNETGDVEFLKKQWKKIRKEIADVLLHSVDETGLIRAESGPWERHLPGKHFTYTTATAVKGLQSASKMAFTVADKKREKKYSKAAMKIRSAFLNRLIDSERNVLKGNLEEENYPDYLDAASIEAINMKVIEPDGEIASNTIAAFETDLKLKSIGKGYMRIPDGDWYDRQEWVVMDLRIASALKLRGDISSAEQLINWITRQSSLNYNLIAELYSEENASYKGAVPMCGFGPGAYIMALW